MQIYQKRMEDPETQKLWLQAFQRSDAIAPPLQRREQQRSGNTNWIHNPRVSYLHTNSYLHRSPEQPCFPCEDTWASAHRLSFLSCYRSKPFPQPCDPVALTGRLCHPVHLSTRQLTPGQQGLHPQTHNPTLQLDELQSLANVYCVNNQTCEDNYPVKALSRQDALKT